MCVYGIEELFLGTGCWVEVWGDLLVPIDGGEVFVSAVAVEFAIDLIAFACWGGTGEALVGACEGVQSG